MLRPQLRVGPWCPWSGGTHRHLLSIKTPGPKPKSKLTVRSHVLGADLLGPPIASVLCAWGSRGWHLTTWAPWSMQCHFLLKHEDLGLRARQGLCTTGICSPPLLGRACLPSSVEWFGVGGVLYAQGGFALLASCFCNVLACTPLSSRERAVVSMVWHQFGGGGHCCCLYTEKYPRATGNGLVTLGKALVGSRWGH